MRPSAEQPLVIGDSPNELLVRIIGPPEPFAGHAGLRVRPQIHVGIAQQRKNRMEERRGGQLDLSPRRSLAVFGNHALKNLELDDAEGRFVLLREVASFVEERADAGIPIEIEGIEPYELVPHLQIADLGDRELSGLDTWTHAAIQPALGKQVCIAGVRVDHPRPVRVEEVLDRKRALVLGECLRGLQPDFEVAISSLRARERLELHEHRRHEVEGDLHGRELPKERHHPVIVLQPMETDPRQDVLSGHQILVERLMHVPEDRHPRHNEGTWWSVPFKCKAGRSDGTALTSPSRV